MDDYADVLGSKLVNAIKSGTASSDQLKTAIEKIGNLLPEESRYQAADGCLDTVDDGQAIRNLIEDLNDVGDAAQDAAGDIGRLRKPQGEPLLWKRLTSYLLLGIRYRILETRQYLPMRKRKMRSPR